MSQQQQINIFLEWVDEIEEKMGWTDNKWTTTAGISASVLNRARHDGIIPKWDACVALAEAAKISPILAFRKAGLLPPGPEEHAQFSDWQYLLAQLPDEDQEMIGNIIEMQFEKRKKDNALKRLISKKAK